MLNDETILSHAHEVFEISEIHKVRPLDTSRRVNRGRAPELTMVNKTLQMIL